MSESILRRDFVQATLGVGILAGIGDFAFLRNLPPLSAAQVRRAVAPVSADIEPVGCAVVAGW